MASTMSPLPQQLGLPTLGDPYTFTVQHILLTFAAMLYKSLLRSRLDIGHQARVTGLGTSIMSCASVDCVACA